jgi:hypothetical protein
MQIRYLSSKNLVHTLQILQHFLLPKCQKFTPEIHNRQRHFNQRKAKVFLNTALLLSPGAKKKNNNKSSDKTKSQRREKRANPLRPHAHTDPLTTTCKTTTPLLCVCPRKTFKKTPKANRHNKRYKASITREKRKKNITKTSQRFKSFPQEKKKT